MGAPAHAEGPQEVVVVTAVVLYSVCAVVWLAATWLVAAQAHTIVPAQVSRVRRLAWAAPVWPAALLVVAFAAVAQAARS